MMITVPHSVCQNADLEDFGAWDYTVAGSRFRWNDGIR